MSHFVHRTAEVDEKAKVGMNVKIWNQAQVLEGAVIGDNCIIGKNVYIDHDVKIGKNCKIQNNASLYYELTVEDGILIEEYSTIGAGSVVTKNVSKHAMVFGNPASQHGFMCKCGMPTKKGQTCKKCNYKQE